MATQNQVAEVRQLGISETLGLEIADGVIAAHQVLTLDHLQDRFNVSRTVARDGVKVLESLGMLYSKRRVGLVVTSEDEWNVYAPKLISWRLSSRHAKRAYVELTQLRIAVEPEAAALAAQFRSAEQSEYLAMLASRLRRHGEAGELDLFMEADVEFHRIILKCTKNSMFAALGDVVGEVLTGRAEHGLMPERPREEAIRAHEGVARAIEARDGVKAQRHMQFLVDEVREALEE